MANPKGYIRTNKELTELSKITLADIEATKRRLSSSLPPESRNLPDAVGVEGEDTDVTQTT
jgi:hypothetical protein